MPSIIEIQHLSKKYCMHASHSRETTLVGLFTSKGKRLLNRLKHPFSSARIKSQQEPFWALKEVSFTISEGDKVGIIGRNGSGKSTLLKILARITEPTAGKVLIRGKLACLLEVGTGFHPELTGRENIYLNGAILGMNQREIKRKFDAIVSFSEIESFLDIPVKRYSSGMYMKLGFAIAAHLESDILVMDEVLAVGDAQFQEKCMNTLQELGAQGRTVIYVSHDLSSVLSLCQRGLYLENGVVLESGPIKQCIDKYVRNNPEYISCWKGDLGNEHIRVTAIAFAENKESFQRGEQTAIHIDYEVTIPHPDVFISLGILNEKRQVLAESSTFDSPPSFSAPFTKIGKHRVSFSLNTDLFHEGEYTVRCSFGILDHPSFRDQEILLKFPIYEQRDSKPLIPRSGISLGNLWTYSHR